MSEFKTFETLECYKELIKKHCGLFLGLFAIIVIRILMVVFELYSKRDGADIPEGLLHGNLAFDLLNDNWRGWTYYLYNQSGALGNEIIGSIIILPFYYLFGPSQFVLSLLPIIYACGIATLAYIFCVRYVSQSAAVISVILIACAPKALQGWSILPYCIHFESALFSLAGILLYLQMIHEETTRRKMLAAAGLGVVSGIGIFHSDLYGLTLAVIAVAWIIKQPRFWGRAEFWACIAALSIALGPFFYFHGVDHILISFEEYRSGRFSGTYTSEYKVGDITSTLTIMSYWIWPVETLLKQVKASPCVSTIIGIGLVIVGLVPAMRASKDKTPILMVVSYVVGFSFTLIKGTVSITYYSFPGYAHMMILISVGLAALLGKLRRHNWAHVSAWILLAVLSFMNLKDIFKEAEVSCFREQLSKRFITRGYCFYWPYNYTPYHGYKTDRGRAVEAIATDSFYMFSRYPNTEPPPRKSKVITISTIENACIPLYFGKEAYYFYAADLTYLGFARTATEIEANVPEEVKSYAYAGMAVFFANDYRLKDIAEVINTRALARIIPQSYQFHFYEEIGRKLREHAVDRVYGNDSNDECFKKALQQSGFVIDNAVRASMYKGFTEATKIE